MHESLSIIRMKICQEVNYWIFFLCVSEEFTKVKILLSQYSSMSIVSC